MSTTTLYDERKHVRDLAGRYASKPAPASLAQPVELGDEEDYPGETPEWDASTSTIRIAGLDIPMYGPSSAEWAHKHASELRELADAGLDGPLDGYLLNPVEGYEGFTVRARASKEVGDHIDFTRTEDGWVVDANAGGRTRCPAGFLAPTVREVAFSRAARGALHRRLREVPGILPLRTAIDADGATRLRFRPEKGVVVTFAPDGSCRLAREDEEGRLLAPVNESDRRRMVIEFARQATDSHDAGLSGPFMDRALTAAAREATHDPYLDQIAARQDERAPF